MLPGLEAKKFDLCIAPVTITKERMKRYAFSVPIADATAALMKRADDKSIVKPEDIAGKTVGGQKGTSQLEQLKAFAAKLPKPVEVKEYVDNNQSYADLAAGRIDASINSLPNLAYAAVQRSDVFAVVLPPFGQATYFSWVGRLDDKTLLDAVNAALVKLDGEARWRRSRRSGSARSRICPRPSPSRRSDGQTFASRLIPRIPSPRASPPKPRRMARGRGVGPSPSNLQGASVSAGSSVLSDASRGRPPLLRPSHPRGRGTTLAHFARRHRAGLL